MIGRPLREPDPAMALPAVDLAELTGPCTHLSGCMRSQPSSTPDLVRHWARRTNDETEEISESAFCGSVARSHGSTGMSGVGLRTLRHSFARRMLAASVPLHTVSELLGHSSVAVTGDVYGHVSTEGRASPSSGSQQQWAGENVCRYYTNGYTAGKRPPRILWLS